jgi:hypothetical protein
VNTSVSKIDLYMNENGAEGALALADALKVNTSLIDIHLDHNNIISVEGTSTSPTR